jgi:hypothetical protein
VFGIEEGAEVAGIRMIGNMDASRFVTIKLGLPNLALWWTSRWHLDV